MLTFRFAGRWLSGQGLQAPVAVVEEAQRLLLPRLFHGRSMSTSSTAGYTPATSNGGNQGLTVDERARLVQNLLQGLVVDERACLVQNLLQGLTVDERARLVQNLLQGLVVDEQARPVQNLLTEIDNKREELYNLSAEVEKNYSIPGKVGRQIRRLRRNLSVQVDPRPNDHEWRWLRAIQRLNDYGGFVGSMVASYMLAGMLTGSVIEVDPKEKRWIQKKRMEAKQEQ